MGLRLEGGKLGGKMRGALKGRHQDADMRRQPAFTPGPGRAPPSGALAIWARAM
jgi:hypothetical protein